MKKVINYIEEEYLKDPVVFQWVNMRRRGSIPDDVAVINLIQALISNKNTAIRALDKRREKAKVLEFKRER